MKHTTIAVFVVLALMVSADALALPSVPGFNVDVYVQDASLGLPQKIGFAPNGDLYVGNADDSGPCSIHFVGRGGTLANPYGLPPVPYGPELYDPDPILFLPSGWTHSSVIAGSVLTGGWDPGLNNGYIAAIWPDETAHNVLTGDLGNPMELALDSTQRLVIANGGINGGVYVSTGGDPQLLFASPVGPGPDAIALDASDRIYSTYGGGEIWLHDPDGTNGHKLATLPKWGPMDVGPGGIWGTDLYVIDFAADELVRIDSVGNVTTVGTGFVSQTYYDIVFGPDDALYVSDRDGSQVLRIVPEPATLSLLGLGACLPLFRRKRR